MQTFSPAHSWAIILLAILCVILAYWCIQGMLGLLDGLRLAMRDYDHHKRSLADRRLEYQELIRRQIRMMAYDPRPGHEDDDEWILHTLIYEYRNGS